MLNRKTLAKASERVSHGDFIYRHKPVPMFTEANGVTLVDADGYRYLDAEAANGTANLGFDSSILKDAWAEITHIPSMPSFCETPLRLTVADGISELLYRVTGEHGRVSFDLGGAQGIELAIKVVKSNHRKSQFVVFEGGYHGRSIFTSQLSASHRYRAFMGDWRVPVIRLPYPDAEFGTKYKTEDEFVDAMLEQVSRLTRGEIGGVLTNNGKADIAALIIEPILNAGGIVKPPRRYLETIVNIFRKLGALIIMDEVFCGFHRTGPMFGFEHYNFIPDIVVLSKALTNGLSPLSCVWAREPVNLPAASCGASYK